MQINTYLHYNGNCAEAFKFYEKAVDGEIVMSQSYGDSPAAEHSPPEMKSYVAQEDVEQWQPLVEWLERPRGSHAPPISSPPPSPVIASA